MRLTKGDIDSIANGRVLEQSAVWMVVWSVAWIVLAAILTFAVKCPVGCWVAFVLLLVWFSGMVFKFLKTTRIIKKALREEIESDPLIVLVAKSEKKEDKSEDI